MEEKPLTLTNLEKYNKEVLIPELEERFVVKKEFNDFKNKSLSNQDKILEKLDKLIQENEIRNYQEKKRRRQYNGAFFIL